MRLGAIPTIAMFLILIECTPLHGNGKESQQDLSGVVKAEGVDPEKSALLIVRLQDNVEWKSGGTRIETPENLTTYWLAHGR